VILAAIGFDDYTNAVFIVVFGVGGIFAGILGYMAALDRITPGDRLTSVAILAMQIIIGLLFFFPIAAIEGGEYRVPFKAFGCMLVLSSVFFLTKAGNMASKP
jgi:drug/metabolite transporter (DMT)-like permease